MAKRWGWGDIEPSVMQGLVLDRIDGMQEGGEEIIFRSRCGREFRMWHSQDCCESVYIEDVCGDPDDLLGEPLLVSDERSNATEDQREDVAKRERDCCESFSWTFYEFRTVKGSVTLRWLGESNGYYSESVYFAEAESDDE